MGQYVVSGVALSFLGLAFMKLLLTRERVSVTAAASNHSLDQPGEENLNGPLETLLQEAPVGIVILDLKANVWKWNRAAERMFGWSRHEVLRRPTPVMNSHADKVLHDRVLGGETLRGIELVLHTKYGKPVEIALTAIPLRDSRGEVKGILQWIVDITGKKRTQQDLQRAQRMATLGRLTGGIVHDFNNVITVVAGRNAMIVQALDQRSPLRARTAEIDRACERAGGLARQLMTFSRGRTSAIEPVDPNAVVREVEGMLERLTSDIKWVIRLDPQEPLVEADCGQIHQALMNLVLNACEAMPNGGTLTIETASVHIGEKRYTLLAVSDTGVGFDETVKDRLFEPFFTTKENGAVGGLGLATVHRVVTEAGGWIQVHSQPKKGARFEIYLPQIYHSRQALVASE